MGLAIRVYRLRVVRRFWWKALSEVHFRRRSWPPQRALPPHSSRSVIRRLNRTDDLAPQPGLVEETVEKPECYGDNGVRPQFGPQITHRYVRAGGMKPEGVKNWLREQPTLCDP